MGLDFFKMRLASASSAFTDMSVNSPPGNA